MIPYSRTFRGHPEWNGRASHPGDHRYLNDQDFNSAQGLRNMSRRERNEVYRRAQGRLSDPYSTQRQRTGLNATMGNVHAANDAERRDRRRGHRYSNVDDLTRDVAGMNFGSGRSRRTHTDRRNIRWHDQAMPEAPEAPRVLPRNGEYYLDRASRPSNSYQDNYNDAYQYMHGERPRRHTATATRHNPREYAHLNLRFAVDNTRHHDPSDSFYDRVRRWF